MIELELLGVLLVLIGAAGTILHQQDRIERKIDTIDRFLAASYYLAHKEAADQLAAKAVGNYPTETPTEKD